MQRGFLCLVLFVAAFSKSHASGCMLPEVCQASNATNSATDYLKLFFEGSFDRIDPDGQCSVAELVSYLRGTTCSSRAIPVSMVDKFRESLDEDGDGHISWSDFEARFRGVVRKRADDNVPQQVHLALGEDASSITVMWSSAAAESVVRYGPAGGSMPNVAHGTSHTYSVDDGLYTSLPIHTVHVQGLQPDTAYSYTCGNGSVWSPVYTFTSPPAPGSPSSRWAVYGDMGTVIPFGEAVTKELIAEHEANPFRIIMHVGDLAYAGVNGGGEWEPTWDVWMNQIEPIASLVPYQVGVGNHENYFNYTAFINRFTMPSGPTAGSNGNIWYSFDYGDVHVTSMSTEHPYSTGSPQRQWIETDLAAARARNVKWLIVTGHRPWYSSDADEYNSHRPGAPLLHFLESLVLKYQVDMVLTGHQHCYERMYPVINGSRVDKSSSNNFTNPTAPVYIVQGTAGAMILEKWVEPQPEWSAVRLQDYGFGVIDFSVSSDASTGETVSSFHYQFKSASKVLDEFWIHKTK